MDHPTPSHPGAEADVEATGETARLAALTAYDILDTPAEAGFDDIVHLASQACETPVALVSFVSFDRQWFKARVGFGACETSLDKSVCAHVVKEGQLLVFPDLTQDALTRDNPLVTADPHIRFYAGAPLTAPGGEVLGALCVIDDKVRPGGLSDRQSSMLLALARQVMSQMELRRLLRVNTAQAEELTALNASLEKQVSDRARERSRTWEITPDILGVLNPQGFFEASNPAWKTTLGWSVETIRTTKFFDFIHPDDLPRTYDAWDAVNEGHPVLRFENRYRHRDGGWRWLSWVVVPEGDKFYCTARDVTREKAQAAELAATTADRERIWRNAHDVITVVDMAGIVQSVNPAAGRVLGWSSEEMVGRSVMDFIHPEDRPPTRDGAMIADRYARPTIFLNRFAHKSGGYRSISWLAALEDGFIYSSGRDVTVETEQANALRDAEESLRQSQKMEAVGQLTGGLAHDFNNLLMGISGSLELTRSRIVQGHLDEASRYIGAAQGAVERAAALTHRLLAFSRRQTLTPEPVNTNRLIADMEELLRRTIGPHIALEVVGAIGLWATLVDGNQLENALLNLCINARDAMPNGGRITIETANKWLDDRAAKERDLPSGQYVSLCVTDTGTGMTPAVAARAFDPFFTTKPIGSGTGLGLSMIYGFARQSGGQVRAYSEIGVGTTMCIYLPRHVGEADAVTVSNAPDQAAQAEQGQTILVVDDEPLVRMLIVEVVEEAGYVALEAADGQAGLRILQSSARVDLVITDVGLPGGMNGRQMADAARVNRPDLRILFVTGYAENAVVGNGSLDAGMSILTKPFAMDTLSAKIHDFMTTT